MVATWLCRNGGLLWRAVGEGTALCTAFATACMWGYALWPWQSACKSPYSWNRHGCSAVYNDALHTRGTA